MSKNLLLWAILLLSSIATSQTLYETISSSSLGTEREIKIQLPRNYEENKKKNYPVIIALDGDYLFEPLAGAVDYYSYWDDIPEAIVVGVNQVQTREQDTYIDNQRYLPDDTGAAFFDFLGTELLPYLRKNYRTAPFAVIAGHDLSANFSNYFLLKTDPVFQAYINLSPDLSPEMAHRVTSSLARAKSPKWFYLATASNDIKSLRESILSLDERLKGVDNDNFHYRFDNFEDASHYSLVGKAIPNALESIFATYAPITMKQYEEEIVNSDISPYQYLLKKYEHIQTAFGVNIPIRVNDFLAVGKALEFNQNWEDLEKLGILAKENYPDSMLGTYYLARTYESNGEYQKAVRTYQSAYEQEPVAFINVDFMLRKAEFIKDELNY